MHFRQLALAAAAVAVALAPVVIAGCSAPVEPVKQQSAAAASPVETRSVARESEDKPLDVVVVGAGISGLSAAWELGRGGARVVVLDMSSVFGGHAVMSQGGLCIVDTPLQRSVGIEDSPDLAYNDFITWGEDADAGWVRYYVDHSRREIYDWLIERGVEFEKVDTAPGNSVDRFHQPAGRGVGLVMPIYRECLDNPHITFAWNSQAVGLLNDNGRVAGVVSRDVRTGIERTYRSSAVVLATGGFQSNLDMVREFWPREFRFPERILAGSGRNSVGLGHKLAEEMGADLVKMDHQWNYFTGIPDPRRPDGAHGLSAANMHGIIVNPQGKRFANLHNWAKEVMPPLLAQERATLWFIFDEATKPQFVVSGSDWADFDKIDRLILQNRKLVQRADTIEELAERAGLPTENLAATIERYNELVAAGSDADFGRFGPGRPAYSNGASPALDTPPYYAMQAFPITRKSMGGVAIDLGCRVLGKDETPIPGLFAVGELTGLAGINGKAALEGTFLGPCVVTGRVAARTILEEAGLTLQPPPAKAASCISCHDVKALLAEPRPGYWHFESSHKIAQERGHDCRHCHAELSPYRKDAHRIDPQALAATCVQCHVARE